MMARIRRAFVPTCAAVCVVAAALWVFSLFRSISAAYSWPHVTQSPYRGAGSVGVTSSAGVILFGGGVEPLAEPSGLYFHVNSVVAYGSTSESMAVRMGFAARGIGQWRDEYFSREYMLPWWLPVLATAWAPVVVLRRRGWGTNSNTAPGIGDDCTETVADRPESR